MRVYIAYRGEGVFFGRGIGAGGRGHAAGYAGRAVGDREDGPLVSRDDAVPAADADLPVVARLVVEIRSDGSRTVARGALEDRATDQRVAVRAEGTSPLSLALALARSLASIPAMAAATIAGPRRRPSLRRALRGALGGRRGKRAQED